MKLCVETDIQHRASRRIDNFVCPAEASVPPDLKIIASNAVNRRIIYHNALTVELNIQSVDHNRQNIYHNSRTVELNSQTVELNGQTVDLNGQTVDLDIRTVEHNI